MPVEVAQINRSLKLLWEQEGNVSTKASLINFVVYSEAADALSVNTQLMEQITREHACRVILLAANPAASKQRVQAWISAHCHITRAGARQVCSEQIAFLLDGGDPDRHAKHSISAISTLIFLFICGGRVNYRTGSINSFGV